MTAQEINKIIKEECEFPELISDGYHSFVELYEHRFKLFIALCVTRYRWCQNEGTFDGDYGQVWRSKLHSDGTMYDGWFIMGINKEKGEQISYHLPISKWDATGFAETLDKAPEWDGHTPDDVLQRLSNL